MTIFCALAGANKVMDRVTFKLAMHLSHQLNLVAVYWC